MRYLKSDFRDFGRVVYGEIFALFQAWIGNFHTIPPWKVAGTLHLVNSYVTFKYFAFLTVWDKFELLGHVQAASMIWVLFSPFFFDSFILVTVRGFIGLFWSPCYFNHFSCKFRGLPGSTPVSFPVMRRSKCLGLKRSSQLISTIRGKRAEKTFRNGSGRGEVSNAKSSVSSSILNQKR